MLQKICKFKIRFNKKIDVFFLTMTSVTLFCSIICGPCIIKNNPSILENAKFILNMLKFSPYLHFVRN